MRPAIEVYRCASYEDAKLYGSIEGEEAAAAVIEADRAELVREIVAELPKLMLKAEVTVELTKAIQAKFGSGAP